MDADGEVALPVQGGKHLKEDFVGSHYLDYDFTVVLSHFKGHAMGGFGGALKNISIGIASSAGKAWIHTAGKTKTDLWNNLPEQDHSWNQWPRRLSRDYPLWRKYTLYQRNESTLRRLRLRFEPGRAENGGYRYASLTRSRGLG